MQSPSPSPPPTTVSTNSSPSISHSAATASSYSSPFSPQDYEDSSRSGQYDMLEDLDTSTDFSRHHLDQNTKRMEAGMDMEPRHQNGHGGMGMFGSSGAIPTLGELMQMDMDMDLGRDMTLEMEGDRKGAGSNMILAGGRDTDMDVVRMEGGLEGMGFDKAGGEPNGVDLSMGRSINPNGTIPAPRPPTSATLPSFSPSSIHNNQQSIFTSNNLSVDRDRTPLINQSQYPTPPSFSIPAMQMQTHMQSNTFRPHSPPHSNTSNRSAKSMGKERAYDFNPNALQANNSQGQNVFASGSVIPAGSYEQARYNQQPSTSSAQGLSSSAHSNGPPPPRRKRDMNQQGIPTSNNGHQNNHNQNQTPSIPNRSSAPSSTGTGQSVRRKNVAARNMGGEGSSAEDNQSDSNSLSSDILTNEGGQPIHKGRRTDKLFGTAKADERATWKVVNPPGEELNDLPLMIRGIKRRGAKSRVETQIKFRICLVRPVGGLTREDSPADPFSASMLGLQGVKSEGGSIADRKFERISTFKAIRLKPGVGMRRKPTRKNLIQENFKEEINVDDSKISAAGGVGATAIAAVSIAETMFLRSQVVCASTGQEALACTKCSDREHKRSENRVSSRAKGRLSESDGHSPARLNQSTSIPQAGASYETLMDQADNHIVSWNCGPLVNVVDGECELAMRMVCYCRHHKEKSGFRMTLELHDSQGRLVASATAPTILITDDHKTATVKPGAIAAAVAGSAASTDAGIHSPISQRSATPSVTSRSEKSSRRRIRDDSVSVDGDVKPFRAAKVKPYNRTTHSDTRSMGSFTGALSPRNGLSHGLSMTPVHGRSVPGSPIVAPVSTNGSYFGMSPMPGPGTISPGVFMPGAEQTSPTGLAAGLRGISQQLSTWNQDRNAHRQPSVGSQASYNGQGMQMDDDSWISPVMDDHQLDHRVSGSLHNGGYDGREFASFPDNQHLRQIEPDFDSMLNLSPNAGPSAGPAELEDIPMLEAQLPPGDNMPPWGSQSQHQTYHSGLPNMYNTVQPPRPPQPKITRVIPPEGDVQGGTEVTILGENFTPGSTIIFGKSPAVTLQLYGPTTLVCLLPPSPVGAGTVPVFVRDLLQPAQTEGSGMTVFFTYHDVSDRKLMEMALTAVGLRVTGKVVGAVEIARRIMSAPQQDGATGANAGSSAGGSEVDSEVVVQEALAQELAQSVYSKSPVEFEQAVIKFLAVFLPDASRARRGDRSKPSGHATLNLINREGQTLLHFASLLGFTQLLGLLLRAGANVDIHDRNGYTALAFAAMAGRESSVRCLLMAGARLAACTFSNETPAMLAVRGGHLHIVQLLHHVSTGQISTSGRSRKAPSTSASDSSPDADNPSSATDSESVDSADQELGGMMSPTRLTTTEDVSAVRHAERPQRPIRISSGPKSDTTATPKPKSKFPLPLTDLRPEMKARSNSNASTERPPPYASADDVSWLQRTLSHLPGSQIMPMTPNLKDYIPPSLWDKLPSAQLLIPNMPDLETTWQSQAWLAVPLTTWLNAQAKAIQAPTAPDVAGPSQTPPEPPASPRARPEGLVNSTQKEEKIASKTSPARQRIPASARRSSRPTKESKVSKEISRGGSPTMAAIELANDNQISKLKPDRMLFLFWLPVLMAAFFYTLITTLPLALGKALLGPALRVIRSLL